MITLTAAVQNSLPRVTYTKYSDWILMLCLVYVFGALVEFAIINFHDSLETRKKDKLNRKLRNVDVEKGVCHNDSIFIIMIVTVVIITFIILSLCVRLFNLYKSIA